MIQRCDSDSEEVSGVPLLLQLRRDSRAAGHLEGNLDNLSLDFNGRSNHMFPPQHESLAMSQSPLWQSHTAPMASSNALPGSISSGVPQYLGMA